MPTEQPTEREPMLSDEQFVRAIPAPGSGGHMVIDAMDLVGYNWYSEEMKDERRAHMEAEFINRCINAVIQAKITSGELRVVKKARNVGGKPRFAFVCSECGLAHSVDFNWDFCPGCSAEIVKP